MLSFETDLLFRVYVPNAEFDCNKHLFMVRRRRPPRRSERLANMCGELKQYSDDKVAPGFFFGPTLSNTFTSFAAECKAFTGDL